MATRQVLGITAAAAAMVVLSACAAPAAPAAPALDASARPATTAVAGVPFDLYTHCGIYEARVNDTFFAAGKPLDDGHGNPPAGWGNPYQPGTITVLGQSAVFRDDSGHSVTFQKRSGATDFLRTCS